MNRILYLLMVFATLAGFCMLALLGVVIYPYLDTNPNSYLVLLIAGLLGVVSAIVLFKRKPISKFNRVFIISCCLFCILFMVIWFLNKMVPRSYAVYPPCSVNLSNIGRALAIYSLEHNRYPDANSWCDVLLDQGLITPQDLVETSLVIRLPISHKIIHCWPRPARGRCDYALNPNARRDSPENAILGFEAQRGWNQHSFEKIRTHSGGLNILYNDYHTSFEPVKWLEQKIAERDAVISGK